MTALTLPPERIIYTVRRQWLQRLELDDRAALRAIAESRLRLYFPSAFVIVDTSGRDYGPQLELSGPALDDDAVRSLVADIVKETWAELANASPA